MRYFPPSSLIPSSPSILPPITAAAAAAEPTTTAAQQQSTVTSAVAQQRRQAAASAAHAAANDAFLFSIASPFHEQIRHKTTTTAAATARLTQQKPHRWVTIKHTTINQSEHLIKDRAMGDDSCRLLLLQIQKRHTAATFIQLQTYTQQSNGDELQKYIIEEIMIHSRVLCFIYYYLQIIFYELLPPPPFVE